MIEVSDLVPEKAKSPMVVTEFGIVMEAIAVLLKTLSPMVVRVLGRLTEANVVAPSKARLPMEVTELGITIAVKRAAFRKALGPMVVS